MSSANNPIDHFLKKRSEAPRAFFVFDPFEDGVRANAVRNFRIFGEQGEAGGFFRPTLHEPHRWQEAMDLWTSAGGDMGRGSAWLEQDLEASEAVVVLAGYQTHRNRDVLGAIWMATRHGKPLLVVHFHELINGDGHPDPEGINPLSLFHLVATNLDPAAIPLAESALLQAALPLSSLYPSYEWQSDGGYANLANWIRQVTEQPELQRLAAMLAQAVFTVVTPEDGSTLSPLVSASWDAPVSNVLTGPRAGYHWQTEVGLVGTQQHEQSEQPEQDSPSSPMPMPSFPTVLTMPTPSKHPFDTALNTSFPGSPRIIVRNRQRLRRRMRHGGLRKGKR